MTKNGKAWERRKRRNYLLSRRELAAKREGLRSSPVYAIIDPVNYCTLRCPFCPVGAGNLRYPKARLSMENYLGLLRQIGPALLHLDFFDWGEPLLHPRIFDMIREAKGYGIYTRLSTNLTHLPPGAEQALVDSGLDYCVLSLDGVDQATYGKYRVGGDFRICLANLERLVEARRRSGGKSPHLLWQYLVFRHNQDHIEEARRMAARLGVDEISFTEPNFPVELDVADWVSTLPEFSRKYRPEKTAAGTKLTVNPPRDAVCHWLWTAAVFNPGGTVSPCCIIQDPQEDFGSVFTESFRAVWNGPAYRAARRFIASGRKEKGEEETVCHRCRYVGFLNAQLESEMSHYQRNLSAAARRVWPRAADWAGKIRRKLREMV
jgi:MoaA/NifB/PqqE/SkfB family radical SAM enzyme